MGMYLATVKNNNIGINRDAEEESRILDCEMSAPEDVQTVELLNAGGEDYNPPKDSVVLVLELEDALKYGLVLSEIVPDPTIAEGERELFSHDENGDRKAKIRFKLNGDLILNDGADFAVAFNKLKTEFNELQGKFNLHGHPGVTVGAATSGQTFTQSIANIDNAKVDKVKL